LKITPLLKKMFRRLPDSWFCGELLVLHESGRLKNFFSGVSSNEMALTKTEKFFVSWAIREYYKDTYRDNLKQRMMKYAITGDEGAKFNPFHAPLGPDDREVAMALQDATREAASRGVFQKTPKNPTKL
jgi:hypothetical protein